MATVFNDTTADHKWSTAGNWSDGKPDSADAVTIGSAVTALEIDEAATCLSFNATGPSSAITISGSGTLAVGGSFVLDTGVTWSGTGAITISVDTVPTLTFAGRSLPVVNLIVAPSASREYALSCSGATFSQLNLTHNADRRDTKFTFDGNFTIGDSSTWIGGGAGNDDPTYRPFIYSSAGGTARTITVSAASKTLTFTDVDFRDITISTSNSPTITGTRVGDCGGNTNCDCDAPKTVYLDAGTVSTVNWYDNYWATSSGGGSCSLNNFPLPQDTAIIDDSSWDDTSNAIAVNSPRAGSIIASLTEDQRLLFGYTTIYGSLDLEDFFFAACDTHGGMVTIDARVAGTLTIINSSTNWNWGSLYINSYGGTVQLAGNIRIADSYDTTLYGGVTLTRGTLDLNGHTLTCNYLSSSNSNTREIKDTAGGGGIILSSLSGTIFTVATTTNLTVSNAPDIQIGDGNKTLTGDITFSGGGMTYGDFTVKKHAGDYDCVIVGNNTFGAFTCETPDATYNYSDVQFTSGTDQNITSLVATGTSSYTISIKAVTGASAAALSDTTGTNTVSYCTIQDMTAEGGATWDADDGTNVNVSGNTGWTWPSANEYRMIYHNHYLQMRMV